MGVPTVGFPSLVGVRTYEKGRHLRWVADMALVNGAKDPAALALVWAALEQRGWWSKEERASIADSVLGAMTLFAHRAE